MMSPYDSMVNETKTVKPSSVFARLIFFFERTAVHFADIVLTDTSLHSGYFAQLYGVNQDKFLPIPVGAFEDRVPHVSQAPTAHTSDRTMNALFFGTFLPLHGIDVMLEAASLVQDLPVQFFFIGGNDRRLQGFNLQRQQLGLKNVIHVGQWVEPEVILEYIAQAELQLGGPFGGTGQASRVVTAKALQSLAVARATVIGKLPCDYGFVDRENCLLVSQSSAKELADAIRWAYHHRDELPAIGEAGYRLYRERFSIDTIAQYLDRVIVSLLRPTHYR
jgi:glycosyltransferase involved in cell wall biosynthesis